MANMDRDGLVAELQARGWGRFTASQLQKYLDWALQDLYAMARFPRSTLTIATISGTVLDVIPFSTVATANELVQQVKKVFVKASTDIFELAPASEEFFSETMWPNTQDPSPTKGAYPATYFVYDLNLFLYPKPNSAVDIFVHYLLREDGFTSGTDTTGLPERFDKAVLYQAEVICSRRAHDVENMAIAQQALGDFLLSEVGQSGQEMEEKYDRVVPWRP